MFQTDENSDEATDIFRRSINRLISGHGGQYVYVDSFRRRRGRRRREEKMSTDLWLVDSTIEIFACFKPLPQVGHANFQLEQIVCSIKNSTVKNLNKIQVTESRTGST